MKNVFSYETEIGKIRIEENGAAITYVNFGSNDPEEAQGTETALLAEASKQLNEYLAGKRKDFDLPLAPEGTEFQQAVWNALRKIPYGETRSYGEVARNIERPKASRAVGMANNRNPIAILIPCHRVIGANGKLVGYAGGLDLKERLLRLEKDYVLTFTGQAHTL